MTIAPPMDRRADAASEAAREHAGRVVHGVYRLVKGRLLHDDANQAIAQLVDALAHAVGDYAAASKGSSVSVLFASNNVFVDRQMLRASRETYQLALELGEMLAPFGVTELSLSHPLDRGEAHAMASAIALAQRDRSLARKERLEGWQTIKARRVVAFNGGSQLTPVQRAARTYAASVLIVQSFYRQLREGATELPHGIKRVAQRLVTAAEDDSRLLLVIAASPATAADRAATAVSAAVLALAMARQLTSDRSALLGLASAAILYDVGRPRLVRSSMSGVERSLGEGELERLPASTVAALTALGKLHPGSLARSVIAYEALALRGGAGKVYGGRRPPSVLARVLHAARTFVEARAGQVPSGSAAAEHGGSMDDAVQALFGQARDATERTYAKLLLGALGLFPAGTLVELTTGELAVVTATPRQPVDFARPPVRILYDGDANLLEAPVDLDLASPPRPGEPARLIMRAVDADEQQMRQMRAYVAGLSTEGSRSAPRKAEPRRAPDPPPEPVPAPVRPPTGPVRAAGTIPPRPRTGGAAPGSAPASMRPRRDPRADDTDPGTMPPAAPLPAMVPASEAPPHHGARPVDEPAAAVAPRVEPHATAASTRAMSWDQYGQLVDETQQPEAVTRTVPPPPDATDALLAAYLDEPSRGGGNHGLRGWGNEPSSQRDSSRAGWGGRDSSGGPTSTRDSSRRDAPSSGGPRSSSQASWSAIPSSRRPGPPASEPPRSRSLSGRNRTCTQDWTTAPRGPSSVRGGAPFRRSSPLPPPPPPSEPPSTGRKPKASRQGWGADKK